MTLASSGCVRTACGLPDARRSACFLGACRGPRALWVSTDSAVVDVCVPLVDMIGYSDIRTVLVHSAEPLISVVVNMKLH